MLDMKSMEHQMDGLYSILQARHIEVLVTTFDPGYSRERKVLENIAACMAAALDSLQHCSEEFQNLKEKQQDKMGQDLIAEAVTARGWTMDRPITIATDGPTGESFNPLAE